MWDILSRDLKRAAKEGDAARLIKATRPSNDAPDDIPVLEDRL